MYEVGRGGGESALGTVAVGKYELWSRGLVSGSFVGLYWGRGGGGLYRTDVT